jgi:hypothetical protein
MTALGPGRQMSRGGVVPGRGNQDTVPALLTPGEYVIPKAQVQQMQQQGQPLRMADGGYVPDPKDRDRPIPRPMAGGGAPAEAPGSTAGSQAGAQQQSSGSDGSGQSQGQQQGDNHYWQNLVNQIQTAQQNKQFDSMGSGAYSAPAGSSAQTVGDVADGAAPTGGGGTQDLGQLGGGAAGGVAAGADVASGLISGLQKAVKTYQDSIKDFQPKPQAFGNKPPPQYQTPTFKEQGS